MNSPSLIFLFYILTFVSTNSYGQKKSIEGAFRTTDYYSGLTVVFKPDLSFTLKFQGHISSDTAAGTYEVRGDTVFMKYDYNNYDTIFASYKNQHKEVPVDIQFMASRVILRPEILVKKRSGFSVVDGKTGKIKTYEKGGKARVVNLVRALQH